MNTETIIEIKKLITEGKNVNYIAKKLNFSKSNIYKLIKKNGLNSVHFTNINIFAT